MTNRTETSIPMTITQQLLRILEPLKNSPSGTVILQHIASIAEQHDNENRLVQNAYSDLIRELIENISNDIPHDSSINTHLQLILLRLTPSLSAAEITALKNSLCQALQNNKPQLSSEPEKAGLSAALNTLSDAFSVTPSKQPSQSHAEKRTQTTSALLVDNHESSDQIQSGDFNSEPAANDIPTDTKTAADTETHNENLDLPSTSAPSIDNSDQRVDQSYRRHLNDKRDRILKIQQTLTRHVNEVIKQNEEFGVLLEVEYDALKKADDAKDLDSLKDSLINEVKKLLKGNHGIATKLDKAKNYLKIIESEGQHLNDELTRVHILSLTDELTELPNRRAFTRRLEDEVARVQRYGSPLSIALIDMDVFKAINDKLGHAAGDEVLRIFSTTILSVFRHHDMVARYGGEEFVILLPNTDIEGTHRALVKVQERAAQTQFQTNGTSLPMPTFSAGVALYKPGETPGFFVERADKALYRAKELGRNRIEISEQDNQATTSQKSS